MGKNYKEVNKEKKTKKILSLKKVDYLLFWNRQKGVNKFKSEDNIALSNGPLLRPIK